LQALIFQPKQIKINVGGVRSSYQLTANSGQLKADDWEMFAFHCFLLAVN